MADLEVGQFELNGLAFGGENDPVLVPPGGFDPGGPTWRDQDAENPTADIMLFGRDRLTPGSWQFSFQTNTNSTSAGLAALDSIAREWRGDAYRNNPSNVGVLRYNMGSGTRRVYGRPRRYAQSVGDLTFQGVSEAVGDFQLADTHTYADEARNIDISIIPGVTRGISSPLSGKLSSILAGEQARSVADIGGTARAPFVAVIYGPIRDPWLTEDNWKLELDLTLAYDQYVVIDTRSFACTVTRNDGANLAGRLTRNSTRLTECRLKPGGANLRFGGKDSTGISHVSVAWRPTYYSL